MIRNRPKLKDVYNAYEVGKGFFGGLYSYLTENQIDLPEWLQTLETAITLDFVYFANHSGEKTISRFVEKFVESDGYITDSNIERISGFFWAVNSENIARYWRIYQTEYNPIENYSMHEETENNHTGTDTFAMKGKETDTNTGTQKLEGESTATGSIFGYDSTTTPAPADKSEGETESTRTDDLTHEKSFTNRENETEYNSTIETETTRTGNIGTLTTQEMLKSDIDLWEWNFYFGFLFGVVDNLLTIPIYKNG